MANNLKGCWAVIRIAVCDDDRLERERMQQLLATYMKVRPHYEIKATFYSAPLELLSSVEEHGGFDLYLLDVYMAGLLGTDAARELRRFDDSADIIFLTSSREHAMEAFSVNAAQYLTKPYTESALFASLDKVFSRMRVERRLMITLKTSEGMVRLFVRNVVFAESGRNNYQIIHSIQGERLEVRMTASALFELLMPGRTFVRCGASLSVNLRFIRQITKEAILFDSGEQVAYPYRANQKLKEAFLQYQMFPEE